jgi:hypothetical protein
MSSGVIWKHIMLSLIVAVPSTESSDEGNIKEAHER